MYFNNCHTLEELKAEYRRLAMENHPDRGSDTATMQRINDEYKRRFEQLKHCHAQAATGNDTSAETETEETPEDFIEIISVLLHLDGLNVELRGRWIWISGNTFQHKAALKEAGCKWASKKKMWYWHKEEDSSGGHKTKSMEYIRAKYGSRAYAWPRLALVGGGAAAFILSSRPACVKRGGATRYKYL